MTAKNQLPNSDSIYSTMIFHIKRKHNSISFPHNTTNFPTGATNRDEVEQSVQIPINVSTTIAYAYSD